MKQNLKQKKVNYKKILSVALNTALEAGELLLRYQNKRNLKVTDKGAEGIASEADEKSEKLILKRLREFYPEHKILSEEDSHRINQTDYDLKSEFVWHIDPLDGTNNFVNGIPFYAVSIGLLHNGVPCVGVVYNPSTGECFYGTKGAPTILWDIKSGKKKKLTKLKNNRKMQDCIFSPCPVYEIDHTFERQISVFRKNILGARAVRRFGAAAMELCYVASGRLDGYWERNLKPWDVTAAAVFCVEAGINLTDFDGHKFSPYNKSLLAAANPLHQRILGKI